MSRKMTIQAVVTVQDPGQSLSWTDRGGGWKRYRGPGIVMPGCRRGGRNVASTFTACCRTPALTHDIPLTTHQLSADRSAYPTGEAALGKCRL